MFRLIYSLINTSCKILQFFPNFNIIWLKGKLPKITRPLHNSATRKIFNIQLSHYKHRKIFWVSTLAAFVLHLQRQIKENYRGNIFHASLDAIVLNWVIMKGKHCQTHDSAIYFPKRRNDLTVVITPMYPPLITTKILRIREGRELDNFVEKRGRKF